MSLENEVPLPERHREETSHRLLYTLVGVVIGVLIVVGILAYESGKDDKAAREKAEKLSKLYQAHGIGENQDIDQMVAVYGNDGGYACQVDESALEATVNEMLSAGAGGVGGRPVLGDSKLVQSTALMMEVYCPDRLKAIRGYIDDLETDDTIDG
ncbi:MAG: hypothetical protein J0H98_06555 [Solirubrobacterales bacterium]|nr:hypothetical protein [Solirubrobacterales bacterium]